MDEVGLGPCSGFLVGVTCDCPLVGGARSCPSDVQGNVKGWGFFGSFELSKTLGSLSAYGWGWVLFLLVDWPEVF